MLGGLHEMDAAQ